MGGADRRTSTTRASRRSIRCATSTITLWHTDFLETYEHAKAGILDLSDPFSGLRKVAESARGTLTTWQEIKDRNPTATVGRWVNGANVSVGVDEMIEDAMEDVATAEGQLAEALGEPTSPRQRPPRPRPHGRLSTLLRPAPRRMQPQRVRGSRQSARL